MDDRDALLRAVAAAPADDLPRLVFADWAEEHGDEPLAAFIRAQVELARTPPWEPFAVRCRHRHADEWVRGTPFLHHLPELPRRGGLEWHPESAFRRGFGWSLIVRDLATFFAHADRLFDIAPVGQLHLPTGTLDDWRHFARQRWLPLVQSILFYGTSTPVEPVRVLCESGAATGLTEIVFEASSGPGMPDVLAGLLAAPAGRRLKSLELRVGPVPPNDLIDALAAARGLPLTRVGLVNVAPSPRRFRPLFTNQRFGRLTALDLVNVPNACLSPADRIPRGLVRVRATGCRIGEHRIEEIENYSRMDGLRALDLSENPLGRNFDHVGALRLGAFRGLRSLALRRTGFQHGLHWLTGTPLYPQLVELDLRDNEISNSSAAALLLNPRPPDLVALRLGGNPLNPAVQEMLVDRFGDAVDFDAGDIGNGLR